MAENGSSHDHDYVLEDVESAKFREGMLAALVISGALVGVLWLISLVAP